MSMPPSIVPVESMSYSSLLKAMMGTQRKDLMLVYGGQLLKSHRRKLGNELWTVMEQVLLSALEYRHSGWIQVCIAELYKAFPLEESLRTRRVFGIVREAALDWDEALEVYKQILAEKPEDVLTRKRIIAMHKSRRNLPECVQQLNRHLEEFSTDVEAWHELGEIYLSECSLGRAMFCFEELLMHDPRSLYNVVTYAELQYSSGNMEMSRKYYCLALSLDGSNIRALWGLVLSCVDPLKSATKIETDEALHRLTIMSLDKLACIYRNQLPTYKHKSENPANFGCQTHLACTALARIEHFRTCCSEETTQ